MCFLAVPIAAVVFASFFTTTAMAALSANDWQSQLQAQLNDLHTQSPSIQAQGNVSVQNSGSQLRAVLPALTVTSPDDSYWTIPSIILQGSASTDAVTILLPSTITRYNAAKKEIAKMTIGTQALNGSWNEGSHSFNTLNGTIKNVAFDDTIAHAKSQIGTVTISANKGAQVQFLASDIRNTTTKDNVQFNSAIGKMNIIYQMPDANQMTLAHLIGYFNPAILLAENKEVVFTTSAEQISMTEGSNRTTSMQKLTTKFDLRPNGKTVSGNVTGQAFIVSQSPASAYAFILPRQLDLATTINNLPVEMVSFAPGMSMNMAKSAMANAGTVINVSKLNLTTFDQGKINGTGSLKANSATPSGFTGRMTFKIENLKDLITTTQAQLLQPDSGSNRSAKTQALMAMMLVQGMGKQEGTMTTFVVDLTADGQTLVNGQDLSGLMGGTKAPKAMPAMPVEKVNSSNL